MLIDALYNKTFPRSCYMANTVVEMRKENKHISQLYERYFGNMRQSYKTVLERAINLGEIKHPERLEEYTEFLMSVIFAISILYKINTPESMKQYIDEQLSLIQ